MHINIRNKIINVVLVTNYNVVDKIKCCNELKLEKCNFFYKTIFHGKEINVTQKAALDKL